VDNDGNKSRQKPRFEKLYYELLWEIGAAQTDAVNLTATNIEWDKRLLSLNNLEFRNGLLKRHWAMRASP